MEKAIDFDSLPLLGRGDIQKRIMEGLERTTGGRGETLLLHGESGTGKSFLARCIIAEAERKGFEVAWGQAYRAESGVPYSLFSDAFLPLLRTQPPGTLNVLTRGGAPELEYLFPGLGEAEGPSPRMSFETLTEFRTRVLWTFSELLTELAKRKPLLVVMEDLQWADPSSLEIIHFVARQLKGHPALLLLIRGHSPAPELLETERSLLNQEIAEAISLPPLSRDDTAVLLEKAFGVDEEVAGAFTDHLHQWTEGNPFFIQRTLETLIRTGQIHRKGETWLGWQVEKMQLPPTVRDALASRLRDLSSEDRSLAELAAILGVRVPFALLRVLSSLEERRLLQALDRLVAEGILSEGLGKSGVVYDFQHNLVRETLLAEMGLARSRLLHGKVAMQLEEHFGDRTPENADTLAYHFLESGSPELSSNALLYLALAGQAALARHGHAEATRYLERALEMVEAREPDSMATQGIPVDRMEILRDLARAQTRVGHYDEALENWRNAVKEAKARDLWEEVGEFRRQMGIILSYGGKPFKALQEFDLVLNEAPEEISPHLRARARLGRGMALEQLGRAREAQAELEGILDHASRLDDPVLLAQAHRTLVFLSTWTGEGEKVRSHAEEALKLARSSGARSVEFWVHWGLAVYEGLLGHTSLMRDLVEKAETVAREIRSPLLSLRSTELAIEHAAAIGEWDRGIALGEQASAVARALSQNTLLPRLLVWTSLIYLGRGRLDLARPMIQEAWSVSGADEDRPLNIHGAIPAHIGMGYLAMAEGNLDHAIRVARAGLEMADEVGYWIWAIHRLLPLLAEAYLWKGDLEGAREVGERLRRDSAPIGHRLGMAWALTCEALVSWLEKEDPDEGARLLEEGTRALESIPMVPDAARVRRLKAGRLADAGDRAGALKELTQVHEVFLRLGAEVELEKTRGMFREIGARPPRRVASSEGVLSSREVEIARLVSDRKSNKAIAKELSISPRTVSTHLSNIYQKLGISSREELADLVRSGQLPED